MAEFKIGDKLIHPVYGVGTLVSIEKRANDGTVTECYVIELARDRGRLVTPVNKAEELGLRKPISRGDRRELLKVFAGHPGRLAEDYRKRRGNIADRLREGNFVEIGRVVRDLAWLKNQGQASMGDRRLLKRAKELLAQELAVADGIELGEAMDRIESALGRSLSGREDQDS